MKNNLLTSLSMLKGLKDNEPRAWDRFVFLYRPLIGFWCQRWGVLANDQDDVIQDIMTTVYTHLANYERRSDDGSFRAWMRGISRNKLLQYSERQRRQPVSVTDSFVGQIVQSELQEPSEEIQSLFLRAAECVRADFSPTTWELFWKTQVDSKPAVEVAREYQVTPAVVRMAKSRVLRRIREEVGETPPSFASL